jgi:hypothetical protein
MPTYEYTCSRGHITLNITTVERRFECPSCNTCGAETNKVILHAPRIFGDYEGYVSPATGKWIEGRRARTEDLLSSGCHPYEAGEREDAARRRAENDLRVDAAVDEAVELAMNELTS